MPPTTIQDLPVELLSKIFRLAGDNHFDKLETLLNSSYVCVDWIVPAQEELWRRVEFVMDDGIEPRQEVQFTRSARTERGTRTKELYHGYAGSVHLIDTLASTRGLKKLELVGGGEDVSVASGVWQLAELAGECVVHSFRAGG